MSLYNMLFGRNQIAPVLLAAINLDEGSVGRFRDCHLNDDGSEIHVFTRNGGGNRDDYMPDFSAHPFYLRDWDDDFDCTYATIAFKTPPEFRDAFRQLADKTDTRPPMERFAKLISDMESGKDNAAVSRALEVGGKIFEAINAGESKTVSTPDVSVNVIAPEKEIV